MAPWRRPQRKLLVDEFTTKITSPPGALALVYPSAIDLSSRTLQHLSGLLAGHRRRIGSRWRRLTCGRQALLVLTHLRRGDTYARLAAGFRVGTATAYRCIREAVDLLAVLAPTLEQAMQTVRKKAYVILDGTVLPIDREVWASTGAFNWDNSGLTSGDYDKDGKDDIGVLYRAGTTADGRRIDSLFTFTSTGTDIKAPAKHWTGSVI